MGKDHQNKILHMLTEIRVPQFQYLRDHNAEHNYFGQATARRITVLWEKLARN